MRIVFGGFQHETNTFATSKADWKAFQTGGDLPGLTCGQDIFDKVIPADIPAGGFVLAAQEKHHTLVPTLWTFAAASAQVTTDAYERISKLLLDGIRQAMPVDAVYLDLHGAMVAEHLDDGEGELLRRVRELVGTQVPIVASLDLHANVSELMLASVDALVAYRTYPHVDKAETGRRAFKRLQAIFDNQPPQAVAFRRIPFLIPICWQSTLIEPAKSLYAELDALEAQAQISSVSFAMGFPASDIPDCAPTLWAYGATQEAADSAADTLYQSILDAADQFTGKLYEPDEAVLYAMQRSQDARKPVIIIDPQDNPGAGGSSDTTGILRALIRHQAQSVALGLIVDPQAAQLAHASGAGTTIEMAIGGRSGIAGDEPLTGRFFIESLSDGEFDATGPFYAGFRLHLGLSACLRIGGIRIVLASNKVQMSDQSMFRFVGIEPTQEKILVLKTTVHFRADFEPIADAILVCVAPGAMPALPTDLPWARLPDDRILYPGGPTLAALRQRASQ